MSGKASAMVKASFLGDSLALGVHWIYDLEVIRKNYGRVESLPAPGLQTYHPTKTKGDLTHYGDQALLLLESIAADQGFDPEKFSRRWRAFFNEYNGYFDQATQLTLEAHEKGLPFDQSGSQSTDLGGAARIAPLVHLFKDDPDRLAESVRAQTALTHNHSLPRDAAEFLARTAAMILKGTSPVEAMRTVVRENFSTGELGDLVEVGLEEKETESTEAIVRFGQSCHAAEGLPGVVHLAARHENDLREALIQNVTAGGDSAARGMAVGMLLGAHLGEEALPRDWLVDLRSAARIDELLGKAPFAG